MTNREYRDNRGVRPLRCTACGKAPCSAWSWDNDPPYSNCCKADVEFADEATSTSAGGD